jgi:hypothetical protein
MERRSVPGTDELLYKGTSDGRSASDKGQDGAKTIESKAFPVEFALNKRPSRNIVNTTTSGSCGVV